MTATTSAHFDPCYLPDGRIIFASTAVYQGLPCEFGAQAMTCLYLLDPPRETVRQLTFEQDSDWCPTMLPNGRVLYLRWEYTDQSHANSRILFHMNPDGTDQREFRGSGSWFPALVLLRQGRFPAHPHQVIGVAGGHHGTPRSGRLLILDPTLGRRDGEGIVQEIPGRGKTGRTDRARPAGGRRLAAVPDAVAAQPEVPPRRREAPTRRASGASTSRTCSTTSR